MGGSFGGAHLGGGFGGVHGAGLAHAPGFAGPHVTERGHGNRGEPRSHHARHFRGDFDGPGYGYTCDYYSPYSPYDCASPYYGW
jgi:hypothetical protein